MTTEPGTAEYVGGPLDGVVGPNARPEMIVRPDGWRVLELRNIESRVLVGRYVMDPEDQTLWRWFRSDGD